MLLCMPRGSALPRNCKLCVTWQLVWSTEKLNSGCTFKPPNGWISISIWAVQLTHTGGCKLIACRCWRPPWSVGDAGRLDALVVAVHNLHLVGAVSCPLILPDRCVCVHETGSDTDTLSKTHHSKCASQPRFRCVTVIAGATQHTTSMAHKRVPSGYSGLGPLCICQGIHLRTTRA